MSSQTEDIRNEWKSLTEANIRRHRMGSFKVLMEEADGTRADLPPGTLLSYELLEHAFRFGVCLPTTVAQEPLTGADNSWKEPFSNFVEEHFNTAVCENAMKWYATDPDGPRADYRDADLLLDYAEARGLEMRGHCLFWDREKFVQKWVAALAPDELHRHIMARINSIIPHFGNRVSCWDAINEMLDGGFFTERLGQQIRADIFKAAHALAPHLPLFVNEFAILGSKEKTARYLELIDDLRQRGAPVGGIGVQEHACERIFAMEDYRTTANDTIERVELVPINYEQVMESLDRLSETGLPIHLTEISAKSLDEERRAAGLEALYRIGFSHPGVDLILLWGFWEKAHWLGRPAALLDADFQLLPAGQRLRQLLKEEWHSAGEATVEVGHASFTGFAGTYALTLRLPDGRCIASRARLTQDSPAALISVAG